MAAQDHLRVGTALANPTTVQHILRKFPSISSFEFIQTNLYLSPLCTLLSAWRQHLSKLKVHIFSREHERYSNGSKEEEWSQLLSSLKGLCNSLIVKGQGRSHQVSVESLNYEESGHYTGWAKSF